MYLHVFDDQGFMGSYNADIWYHLQSPEILVNCPTRQSLWLFSYVLQKYVARKSFTKNQFSLSYILEYLDFIERVSKMWGILWPRVLLWHDCIVRDVGQVFIGRDTDQLHMLSSRQKDCHRHFYFHLCRIVDDNVNENLVVFCVFCFNFSSFSSCSVTQVLCPRSSSKQISRSTCR